MVVCDSAAAEITKKLQLVPLEVPHSCNGTDLRGFGTGCVLQRIDVRVLTDLFVSKLRTPLPVAAVERAVLYLEGLCPTS